jgi:hypothetical protein
MRDCTPSSWPCGWLDTCGRALRVSWFVASDRLSWSCDLHELVRDFSRDFDHCGRLRDIEPAHELTKTFGGSGGLEGSEAWASGEPRHVFSNSWYSTRVVD